MDGFCAICHSLERVCYITGMFIVDVTRILKFEANARKHFV
jgi:hypothetical protein